MAVKASHGLLDRTKALYFIPYVKESAVSRVTVGSTREAFIVVLSQWHEVCVPTERVMLVL